MIRERASLGRTARAGVVGLIFSLGFMKPAFALAGFAATPTDLLFLLAAALWLIALAAGQVRLRCERGYGVIIVYLAALALSAMFSADPARSAVKMMTQFYLAGLAVVVCSLTEDLSDLRRYLMAWLAATAVVAITAVVSLALFWLSPESPFLKLMLFHFGTLPPGHYPRLALTFLNANMLCNYLSVSLMILLVAKRLDWIGRAAFGVLACGIALGAVFTISPGLGGMLLVGGLWLWLLLRFRKRLEARLVLAAGIAGATLFVAATAVTPILHPTAPFLIHLPGTALMLAPAGRMLTWMAAVREFVAHPLLGHGIGVDAVLVHYADPSGNMQSLTDAHNTYLNIAAQSGLVGVAAMLALLAYVARGLAPLRIDRAERDVPRLGLGIAFLGAFAYQGLGGSFEDARHLWVLLGLVIAAQRIAESRDPLEHRPPLA